MRSQFSEFDYCCSISELAGMAIEEMVDVTSKPGMENIVVFETGALSREEVEAIFNTLPVEITFVDKEDKVRYFSQSEKRIFERTKAALGLKVQQCHPQKSIHIVNQILEEFKSGRMDIAHFWINFKGRLVYIQYFSVRNKNRDYLGCLEVAQDVSEIKKLEGEKKLFDLYGFEL